ncbi:MAG: 50S ribosomal protein L1 [Patescibacteria group bacterium]|nr:50S ribosomal protein L1 [Patescibacteria group bacterium]
MGKVRIKAFGSPEEEEQEKKKLKQKKEAKKMAKVSVASVVPSEADLEKTEANEKIKEPVSPTSKTATALQKKEKFIKKRKHQRSEKFQTNIKLIDKNKLYSLSDALKILSEFKKSKFDETVELHVNTNIDSLSANVTLPHGSGKTTKVAVADDKLIAEIEKGKINFDILVSTPSMMPKLAKVARILGPRKLMPNPKNGTITQDPEKLIKKFGEGLINLRTETKAPIIHLSVGKISFGEKKLTDNIMTLIEAIKKENIAKAVLKSTMSPGIKIKL